MNEKEFISSWVSKLASDRIKNFPADFISINNNCIEIRLPSKTLLIGEDMKSNILWLTIFVLSGCVAIAPEKTLKERLVIPPIAVAATDALTNIDHVYVGMTRSEVRNIMGEALTIGYEKREDEVYEPIVLKQPYRQEDLIVNDIHYQIDFYVSSITEADGVIAEDEYVPLIFIDDKLVGKGWDFYFQLDAQVKK